MADKSSQFVASKPVRSTLPSIGGMDTHVYLRISITGHGTSGTWHYQHHSTTQSSRQ